MLTLSFSKTQEPQIWEYYFKIVMQSRFWDLPEWQEMDDRRVKLKSEPDTVEVKVLDTKLAMI